MAFNFLQYKKLQILIYFFFQFASIFITKFFIQFFFTFSGIFTVEICWLIIGIFWLYNNYDTCDHGRAKDVIFTFTICNSVVIFIVILIGWCAFDTGAAFS